MAIDVETERLMLNWVRWLTSAPEGMAAAATYELAAARGWAQDTPIPLINSDAEEVERAMKAIDQHLRKAVTEYWLSSDLMVKRAKRCGCPLRTFWRRLERGHQAIQAFRQGQRVREDRVRAQYRKGAFQSIS